MTKLQEWLSVLGVLTAIWYTLVTNKIETNISKQYSTLILYSPVVFVGLFGIYALTVVLYRAFTFNNCEGAAKELQEEIEEAKYDLQRLGFQFTHTS